MSNLDVRKIRAYNPMSDSTYHFDAVSTRVGGDRNNVRIGVTHDIYRAVGWQERGWRAAACRETKTRDGMTKGARVAVTTANLKCSFVENPGETERDCQPSGGPQVALGICALTAIDGNRAYDIEGRLMKRFALATLFALTFAVPSAHAATIQLDINVLIDGGAVQGDSTVATLLFEDVAPNQVRLTVTSSLNNVAEFFSDIAFNVASGFTPSAITAQFVAGSQVGSFALPTLLSTTQNSQNPAGPTSGYDSLYTFTTNNAGAGANRFNLNDSFQYLFTANGLDAFDFQVANTNGYYAFAHVQGIGPNSTSSAYVTTDPNVPSVPEPTSLVLLATGLLAGARTLRKRA